MILWWANATVPVKGDEMGEGEMQLRNQLHDKLLPKFKLNLWSSRWKRGNDKAGQVRLLSNLMKMNRRHRMCIVAGSVTRQLDHPRREFLNLWQVYLRATFVWRVGNCRASSLPEKWKSTCGDSRKCPFILAASGVWCLRAGGRSWPVARWCSLSVARLCSN